MHPLLFAAALAGGGYLLYRHINPPRRPPALEQRTANGRSYLIRRAVGTYDVLAPDHEGEGYLVRVATDTNRALSWAKNAAALQAMTDLGVIRPS